MALHRRTRRAAAAGLAVAALAAAPAAAFDAGPHTDMTRDAFTSEGFGINAANVGVVENWFVDYYWNAKENPFSGHAGMLLEALANANIATIERWPDSIINGTNHMHFDSSSRLRDRADLRRHREVRPRDQDAVLGRATSRDRTASGRRTGTRRSRRG